MKIKCSICGKEQSTDIYYKDFAQQLENLQLCFTCNFWKEQHELDLTERGEHNYAIVNGEHYVLAPPTNSPFKGFGGHLFTFKFFDGTTKQCNNVWFQGRITDAHPHWRELMPDNAEIVR